MSQVIPEKYADLLDKRAFGNLGTLMKDGSPQVTPVWVDYDGKFVRINSAKGRVKDKNIRRDPRVSIAIQDPENPYRYLEIRGKVVEIIDGKTAVVETPASGKITVVLQFIETPEVEQPLYEIVRQHLADLILGKTVELMPRRILNTATIGQVFLNGVDISQQMIRDGAAWYALPEKSAQDAKDSEDYLATEAQAKTEKRGVWSIENLKTAWEFRAEKEEIKRREEKAKLDALMARLFEAVCRDRGTEIAH